MPRNFLIFAMATGLVACNPDEEGKDTSACVVVVEETSPEEGATDAYYRGSVEFTLSGADQTASASLQGPDGVVAGETVLSTDAETAWFVPDEPLAPLSAYDATMDTCGGSFALSFQTSAYGQPRTVSPVGQVYVVDLTSARFIQPAAIAGIIGQALRFDVLLGVTDLNDGADIGTAIAIAREGIEPPEQDFCSATTLFDGGDFTGDPWFHLGPVDTTFNLSDHDAIIRGLEISATFSADGTSFGGGQLSGQVDARENVGLFQQMATGITDGDSACGALASFGVNCEACDDGQAYCMNLVADSITAPAVDSLVLQTVEQARCHAMCEDNAEDCVL